MPMEKTENVYTLFDDDSIKEKLKVMDKMDAMLDDSRNPSDQPFVERVEAMLQLGKSYKVTFTVEEVEPVKSSITESSHRLHNLICPDSLSRPSWFTCLGIRDTTQEIVLYASDTEMAYKFLEKHCFVSLGERYRWENYSVFVRECGTIGTCA